MPAAADPTHGPHGDPERHLPGDVLEKKLGELSPPRDAGRVALIVSRREGGVRETPSRAALTPQEGVPGDAWYRTKADKIDAQIAVMRVDVAELFANGQSLALFGDNLLVDLDLSVENLPTGTRLRIGGAEFEVTAEPHNGCLKFKQRVGPDALRLTAAPHLRSQRLRGIYLKVVEAGEVAVGDAVDVVHRPS
jgi:hypothetical protein